MSWPTSLSSLLPLVIALFAGAVVPFQAASNAALGRAFGHPLWATLTSLTVSVVIVLPMLVLMRAPAPNIGSALQGPWWLWVGGVAGVIYVTAALILTPSMGAGSFIVCVIAGQVLASLLIDHFGLMGFAAKPVNIGRISGVALILVGMVVVQMSSATAAVRN